MKKIQIGLMVLCAWWWTACTESDDIDGEIPPLTPEYELPQGKSSADDRIVEYYEQYGTYILYEYTDLDFKFGFTSYGGTYTLPDPTYAGDMVDLLEDIWFDFYPVEFHRKYMPLKLFLAKVLEYETGDGSYMSTFSFAGTHCFTVGYCSDTLRKITPQTRLQFKNDLQKQLWMSWANIMEFPKEFFEVSNYTFPAEGWDTSSENYARKRGFVADYSWGDGEEWSVNGNWETGMLSERTDLLCFLINMVTRTSADWASDLAYPLVKQKYDILRNWFLEKYHFDVKKIGDATYE